MYCITSKHSSPIAHLLDYKDALFLTLQKQIKVELHSMNFHANCGDGCWANVVILLMETLVQPHVRVWSLAATYRIY